RQPRPRRPGGAVSHVERRRDAGVLLVLPDRRGAVRGAARDRLALAPGAAVLPRHPPGEEGQHEGAPGHDLALHGTERCIMTARKSRATNGTATGNPFIRVALDLLQPARINDKVYKPVDPDDQATRGLVESMRQFGWFGAMAITRDKVIVSGH